MKKILLAFGLISSVAIAAKAQDKPLAPSEYRSHLYKEATLRDVVYQVKILSDTVTYLYMGGNVPHEKFTIAVKGNKLQLDWANLKTKHLCVTGTLLLYKNTIQIIASEPNQITIDK
ncbi:hypothetical protein [Mucilaginibacter sp. dw_454]|uniref:hypothetical protein n=1 Tax=Mucilaginibacter sp. dw_454 TaxID=2720079 RepID=UPI001BD48F2C|nr:hypothetical protein [Mucilaginibacter sp. dw_454]